MSELAPDGTDWNPAQQLSLWGMERSQQLAAANARSVPERERASERLWVAHEMMSALPADDDLAFSHSIFCQTFLPHSRPSNNQSVWRRQSGRVSLFVRPGLVDERAHETAADTAAAPRAGMLTAEAQESMFVGVPYGARARLILLFLQSEAVRTKRPEVHLGRSLAAWMRSLGVARSGGKTGTVASVREQALRIGLCTFTLQFDGEDARGRGVRHLRDIRIVEGLEMVAGVAGARWPEAVRLGGDFFEHLREHAVPLDRRSIAHLAGNSLGLDLLCLFAHRLPRLRAELRLTWAQLASQLGAGESSLHSLAQRIREVLPDVAAAYPGAKVEKARFGLVLRPSNPLVPRTTFVGGMRLLDGTRA